MLRVRESDIVPNRLTPALAELARELTRIAEPMESMDEQIEYESAANRQRRAPAKASVVAPRRKLPDQAYWIEGHHHRRARGG